MLLFLQVYGFPGRQDESYFFLKPSEEITFKTHDHPLANPYSLDASSLLLAQSWMSSRL